MAVQNHDVGCGLGTVKLTIQVGDPQGLQFEELDVIAGTVIDAKKITAWGEPSVV